SLSVAIPAIQPRLRLSGTNRLRFAFHGGQRMKKSKIKYRMVINGRTKQLLNAQELYTYAVKWEWRKVRGIPWKAVKLDVELGLSDKR
ncbi:MAG: hypothetical protein KZQ71_03505, partial [Candidatus Thiodiazotropha sp. (ex Lucinoma aequizonata)]|nr:hypothetical protein [Candidatus Thiodiazotropha sp. (ex Lucinoma aequizonata)]